MLQKYLLYTFLASLFFYLGNVIPGGAFIHVLGWACLLIHQEEEKSWFHNFRIGLIALFASSLGAADSWAITNIIAWTLFISAKKLWGAQRAYIAFLFLLLSAEAIAFYTPVVLDFVFINSLSLYQVEFWAPWLNLAGFLGASLHILIMALFVAFAIIQLRENGHFPWPFTILSLGMLLFPIIWCLAAGRVPALIPPSDPNFVLAGIDKFTARLSFFLAFFLLLFALVRRLLPKQNADDRFT